MNLLLINAVILFLFAGCTVAPNNPVGRLVEDRKNSIQPAQPLVLIVINPGDCQTCTAVGKTVFAYLFLKSKLSRGNIFIIVPPLRPSARRDLLTQRFPSDVHISEEDLVENAELLTHLNLNKREKKQYTFVSIYDEHSTLIYSSDIKAPTFMSDLAKIVP